MLIAVYAWTINRTKCPFALIVNLYIINHSRPATALITADWRLLSNYKAPGGIITLMRRRKRVEKPRKEPEDGTSEQVARYWPPHTYEECLSVSSCPRRGLRALSSPLCVIPRVVSRHFSLSLSLSLSLSSFFLLRYFSCTNPGDFEEDRGKNIQSSFISRTLVPRFKLWSFIYLETRKLIFPPFY